MIPPNATRRGRPLNLLLVEDDADYRRLVRSFVERSAAPAMRLATASTLDEATLQLAWERPDLLLLDLQLPDCDGLAAVRRARALATGLPIVVLTSRDDPRAASDSRCAGADELLVKQETPPQVLIHMIRDTLAQRALAALRP